MKHVGREKRKSEVLDIWQSNYPHISVAKVSALTGLGERVIYDYLKELGQPLPPKRSRQVAIEQVRLAHKLFVEHGSKSEVGRLMGISRQRVGYYLKKELEC